MDLGIEGRVALVVGASRGLGLATARSLAREGAKVAVTSRSPEGAREAASKVGADALGLAADTDNLEALEGLVESVAADLGPVEILVTNTGGPPPGAALSFDRDAWERAYRSLVLAPLTLIEAVVPAMRSRAWGRIVNIGSSATKEPIPSLVLSNVNRAAGVGLFKTLARELAANGIVLNTVSPGRILTDRLAELSGKTVDELRGEAVPDVPAGRLGRPEEFAAAVTFLCAEPASYITGVNLMVDGGMTAGV